MISFILLLIFNEKPLPANALKEKKSDVGTTPNATLDASRTGGFQTPELMRFGGADKNITLDETAEEENVNISNYKKSKE